MKNCLLDDQTRDTTRCKHDCERCGWNREEAKRRERLIAENKFIIRKNGLKKLDIRREESEE